mmetsp:Transcript_6219/g.9517  ORF Transcript_6219/g.9517 Transcript_6219/m.9517 type:complete len:203 (-) Transcript_6219:6-614(-)
MHVPQSTDECNNSFFGLRPPFFKPFVDKFSTTPTSSGRPPPPPDEDDEVSALKHANPMSTMSAVKKSCTNCAVVRASSSSGGETRPTNVCSLRKVVLRDDQNPDALFVAVLTAAVMVLFFLVELFALIFRACSNMSSLLFRCSSLASSWRRCAREVKSEKCRLPLSSTYALPLESRYRREMCELSVGFLQIKDWSFLERERI